MSAVEGEEEFDIEAALGAEPGTSIQSLAIYIPNKDRHGVEIGNQRKWVLEAINLLSPIGGGATAMPPVEGAWLDDKGGLLLENPVLVYSYIKPENFFPRMGELREFLHRMGRETDQGEVAFTFDDSLYRIRNFDSK